MNICQQEQEVQWAKEVKKDERTNSWAGLQNVITLLTSAHILCVNVNCYRKMFKLSHFQVCHFFISSVTSSYSHPDLLLIHHPTTHFFRSHRSSTLDFHLLSQ